MTTTEAKLTSLAHINTLWELLDLTLADVAKAEKCESVVIDMGEWHEPGYADGKCAICAAGSVMRETLGLSDVKAGYPSDFDDETSDRLWVINDLRCGYVVSAWRNMRLPLPCPPEAARLQRQVTSYHTNRDQWWADMRQLLADLKAANL